MRFMYLKNWMVFHLTGQVTTSPSSEAIVTVSQQVMQSQMPTQIQLQSHHHKDEKESHSKDSDSVITINEKSSGNVNANPLMVSSPLHPFHQQKHDEIQKTPQMTLGTSHQQSQVSKVSTLYSVSMNTTAKIYSRIFKMIFFREVLIHRQMIIDQEIWKWEGNWPCEGVSITTLSLSLPLFVCVCVYSSWYIVLTRISLVLEWIIKILLISPICLLKCRIFHNLQETISFLEWAIYNAYFVNCVIQTDHVWCCHAITFNTNALNFK